MDNPALPAIQVSIDDQCLRFMAGSECYSYPVSTALKGVGQMMGSNQTPLGRHRVVAKIGADMPAGSVFVGRRFSGEIYSPALARKHPERDWILTRILWLQGLDAGINRSGQVDSMRRYIYIHGTPDSEPVGVPKSHGCIRMRNQDVVELFDLVAVGTPVVIQETTLEPDA